MSRSTPVPSCPAPRPVLFLVADTGGGHRAAAQAVAGSLRRAGPGSLEPVLLDPLGGPGSAWLLRRIVRLYGPAVRRAPRLWGLAYRLSDSHRAMDVLGRTVLRLADRPVRAAAAGDPPAAVVSFHALATGAAIRVARSLPSRPPVLTVVTDLGVLHAAWCHDRPDWLVLPPGAAGHGGTLAGLDSGAVAGGGTRRAVAGLPVAAGFTGGPLTAAQRLALRRSLGVRGQGFLAVLTGGAEGAGPLRRSARALLRGFSDVSVAVICGRNRRAQRALGRLAARADGRLLVLGPVTNMADWLRCADVVVTKAGPATIAEAACCGAAMLITSRLPGQEAGNAGWVVRAGAGRYTPRAAGLLREMARLRADPAALATMRAAAARLGQPGAADEIAALIARLAQPGLAGFRPGQAIRAGMSGRAGITGGLA